MLLDELQTLIETLQDRITKHGPALRQSEALTRYALIDPLLRELGWDTSDPAQVLVEYRLPRGGSADYALLGADGRPQVIIEAKHLDMRLNDAVDQVINYCTRDGYEFFAVTDGQRWELYETHRRGDLTEKCVMQLDLARSVAATCLDALALWRPSVAEGHVRVGATPVVDTQALQSDSPAPSSSAPVHRGPEQWHLLSEFEPTSGTSPGGVRFPDQTAVDTRGWGDFIAEIGRWLYENGHLSDSLLPIQRSRNSYVVAKEPVNPTGKNFSASRQIGPFYANVNFASVALVRDALTVIEQTGQNPANFAVRLAK